jgi:hypothetical protein
MGNWQLDPFHTQVEFSAKHLGMMTVRVISPRSAPPVDHVEEELLRVDVRRPRQHGVDDRVAKTPIGVPVNVPR